MKPEETGGPRDGASAGRDQTTTLGELRQRLQEFTAARSWEQFHTPRSLAISIAIESAELMEHYQWHEARPGSIEADEAELRSEIAAELADILIYCLHFANAVDIDVADAILAKLARNEQRFPPGAYRGTLAPAE